MSSRSILHAALHANLTVIQQGIRLLQQIGDDRYVHRVEICYGSSIGGHMRHIIEHYQSFLVGFDFGEIDYEKRVRDPLIEGNPAHAATTFEVIATQLSQMAIGSDNASSGYCPETVEGVTTGTSILRELEFLLSHTIHHYALVAVMAQIQGYEPERTFGIAPSTLKYQETQRTACAR